MIKSHIRAARDLNEIRGQVIALLKTKKDVTEKEAVNLILKEYRRKKMRSSESKAIVSFGKSTSEIHHISRNIRLKEGLIMLDIWAKHKNGAFADLTWMFCKGKPKKELLIIFQHLVNSRNRTFNFIKSCLKDKYAPTYFEIDAISRAYLAEKRIGYAFQHRIGHELGKKVHAGEKSQYYEKLKLNAPYTLEPGIYFKNKFGIRLENNFWIDKNFKLHTTDLQNKLIII